MKKVEAIICDMDGTAVFYDNEPWHCSWDEIMKCLGEDKKRCWIDIMKKYSGKGDSYSYEAWSFEQALLLKDTPVRQAEDFLFPIPYTQGFQEFFKIGDIEDDLLKNIKKGILTAGLENVAEKIKEERRFDFVLGNRLHVDKGYFTGGVDVAVNLHKKGECLQKIIERYKFSPENVCYVDDTLGGVPCFEIVGIPVAFSPKQGLEEYAKRNDIFIIQDFRELNNILI